MKRLLMLALMIFLSTSSMLGLTGHQKKHSKHSWKHFQQDNRVFLPSRQSLLDQNMEIDRLGLTRIQDNSELLALIHGQALVRIDENKFVTVSPKLPQNRRYVRPVTEQFLQDLGLAFYMEFAHPIQVNSAVRTMKVQRRLLRFNRNAAPIHGEVASSHMSGLTVDLERRRLTKDEREFIQQYLLDLGDQVIVEEEHGQECFHILVRGDYTGVPDPIENERDMELVEQTL